MGNQDPAQAAGTDTFQRIDVFGQIGSGLMPGGWNPRASKSSVACLRRLPELLTVPFREVPKGTDAALLSPQVLVAGSSELNLWGHDSFQ